MNNQNSHKMTKQVLKTIAFGLLIGFAIFAFPIFLLKVFFATLIIGSVMRMLFWRSRYHHMHMRYAWADKWQNMTEEERGAFMEKRKAWKGYHHHGHAGRCGQRFEQAPPASQTEENK